MKAISLLSLLILFSCAHQGKQEDPITKAINSRNRQFQQCHMESDSHKQAGKVRIRAILNGNGVVKDTYIVDSTFNDPNLHACLEGILAQLKFPPGYADEFEIPFSFQSGQI